MGAREQARLYLTMQVPSKTLFQLIVLYFTHTHTRIRIHMYYCLTSAAQWRELMGDKRFLNDKLIGSLLKNILINIIIIKLIYIII